ncbi:MAG: ATP-binding protein, partial [Polyangiales bacterium]
PAATEALRQLPAPAREALTALVPELARPSLPPSENGYSLRPHAMATPGLPLFDAIARLLRGAASRIPLVLVLDDLHWADSASLTLLGYLLEELASARLLVLGTFRDVELPPGHPHIAQLDRFERAACFKRVALQGLSVPDVARYLEELTGQTAPPEVVERLHERTAGNPFFVRETVRSLTTDALSAGHLRVFEVRLPEGARDVMRRRLALLPEAAQQTLRAASVLGLQFDVGMLGGMVELDRDALLAALDRALAARLVVREQGSLARYAFAHAVVRDAIYDDLPSGEKCELHLRAGEALERQRVRPGATAELALHFYRALPRGDGHKAFEHGKRAAEQARAAGDHEQAAAFYRRAYEGLCCLSDADPDSSAELMLALGRAHRESGQPGAAREALDRVLELSAIAGASERWAKAARVELERLS